MQQTYEGARAVSTNIELTSLTSQVSAPPGGELVLRFGVTNRGPSTDRVQLRVLAVPPDAPHTSHHQS